MHPEALEQLVNGIVKEVSRLNTVLDDFEQRQRDQLLTIEEAKRERQKFYFEKQALEKIVKTNEKVIVDLKKRVKQLEDENKKYEDIKKIYDQFKKLLIGAIAAALMSGLYFALEMYKGK